MVILPLLDVSPPAALSLPCKNLREGGGGGINVEIYVRNNEFYFALAALNKTNLWLYTTPVIASEQNCQIVMTKKDSGYINFHIYRTLFTFIKSMTGINNNIERFERFFKKNIHLDSFMYNLIFCLLKLANIYAVFLEI